MVECGDVSVFGGKCGDGSAVTRRGGQESRMPTVLLDGRLCR